MTFAPRWLATAALLTLPLAACASTTGATDPNPTDSVAAVDEQQAWLDHAKCMREHGVDWPDPSTSDTGPVDLSHVDFDELNDATEACDPILAEVVQGFVADPEKDAEFRDRELAFARCMRDEGIADWPDPSVDGNSSVVEIPAGSDPDEVAAAMKTCRADDGDTTVNYGNTGGRP